MAELLKNLPTYEEMPPGSIALLTLVTQTILHLISKVKEPKGVLPILKMVCMACWMYSMYNFRKYPIMELGFELPWPLGKLAALPTGEPGMIGFVGFMLSLKMTLQTVL
jgi:hypothetical protein